jgi:hypothetical protein
LQYVWPSGLVVTRTAPENADESPAPLRACTTNRYAVFGRSPVSVADVPVTVATTRSASPSIEMTS